MSADYTPAERRAWYKGIIAALGMIRIHDHPVIRDDIIEGVDTAELIKVARREGDMRWSGISDYLREKKAEAALRAEDAAPGWIFVIDCDAGSYKIGGDPVDIDYGGDGRVIILEKVLDYIGVEAELHKRYADKRQRGEWFSLSADDLAEIRARLLALAIERIKAP